VTIPPPPLDPSISIREILAEPAFRSVRSGDVSQDFWSDFWAWFGQQIGHLLERLIGAASGNTGRLIGDFLTGAAIVGIIFVVCYLALRFAASRTKPLGSEKVSEDSLGAPSLIGRAQASADQGDYARAIAMLFAASLAIFDEKGIVAYDSTRTAWEYERILQARRSYLFAPFRTVVRSFVRVAFAAGGATQAEYEEVRLAVMSIGTAAV